MLHKCYAMHALWGIWDVEIDGRIHFLFDSMNGQGPVKLSKISVVKIFLQKNMDILSNVQFCLRIKRMSFIFRHKISK